LLFLFSISSILFSHVFCGLPFLFFFVSLAFHIILVVCLSSGILIMCPYHASCFFSIVFCILSVSSLLLISSFLILSILVTPSTLLKYFISAACILLLNL